MISIEDIQKYLPQYLSSESQDALFNDLKEYPNNLDKRLYSYSLQESENVYQGDGINGIPVVNLPDTTLYNLPVVVLSNTCDVNPENPRFFKQRLLYAPIFDLDKYHRMLINKFVESGKHRAEAISAHIDAIKKQEITQILFLPKGSKLENDSVVFLDRINNYPAGNLSFQDIVKRRLFVLSNYGFYFLLIKLSIHFTRIREKVDRKI